eukprot:scaffold2551_cov113-Cylindrotheca_fusiformis.AAC.23
MIRLMRCDSKQRDIQDSYTYSFWSLHDLFYNVTHGENWAVGQDTSGWSQQLPEAQSIVH